jgi:predicted ArsR family transcriptional regulator
MMTITDIATRLGTNRATAYGLIHFMKQKGLLSAVDTKKSATRGKPADLYLVSEAAVAALADAVKVLTLPATETPVAPTLPTETEHAAETPTAETAAVAF